MDVVRIIASAFKRAGLDVMPVDELLEKVKNDNAVWELYANGFTQGLNQVERAKTTERVMRYKPRNVVELAAFVAGVRPGFKSMLETFVERDRFAYHIPMLDKLLQTKEIPDSFLLFDEQILTILQYAGIPPADAYAAIKAIKKKKAEKVKSYRERFETGFIERLMSEEKASEKDAKSTVEKVWQIINDSASYLFCAAHAFSMACDSLYAAWLKVHYPYELYASMLEIYTEKKNKEKIAAISQEMKKYRNITVISGLFGQDNRGWYIDKQKHTISQDLSSIKFISSNVPDILLEMSKKKYDTFCDFLYDAMDTKLNKRQLIVLIKLNYFSQFGGSAKLMKVYDLFKNGPDKIYKTLKESTIAKRLEKLREAERAMPDEILPLINRIRTESDALGRCVSFDRQADNRLYYIEDIDATYSIKVALYSMQRGTSGEMRISKIKYHNKPLKAGQSICIKKCSKRNKYIYKNGKGVAVPGQYIYWIDDYDIVDDVENEEEDVA